jgi:hypothetical protein
MAVKRVALARRPGERNSSQANQLLPTHPVFAQSLFLSPSPSRRSVACEADRGAPGVAASGADFIFDMVEPSPLTPEERLIEAPGLSVPAFAAKGAACAIANESMTMAKVFINVSLWLDGSKWSTVRTPTTQVRRCSRPIAPSSSNVWSPAGCSIGQAAPRSSGARPSGRSWPRQSAEPASILSSWTLAPTSEAVDSPFRREAKHSMRSDAVTSVRPAKNIALGTNCRPGIHHDIMKEISEETAGIKRKNIVT